MSEAVKLKELLARVEHDLEVARKAAHEAPMNPLRTDHDGHRWIDQISTAWARRGDECIALSEQARKLRALLQIEERKAGGEG